jgi:hypothetical protein
VGVGSTGVGEADRAGDVVGIGVGAEVGGGDSFGGSVVSVAVGIGRVPLCGIVTVGVIEVCLCSFRRSAIKMIVSIAATSNLKRS